MAGQGGLLDLRLALSSRRPSAARHPLSGTDNITGTRLVEDERACGRAGTLLVAASCLREKLDEASALYPDDTRVGLEQNDDQK